MIRIVKFADKIIFKKYNDMSKKKIKNPKNDAE